MTTPRFDFPRLVEGQEAGEITHNESLNRLDSFVDMAPESYGDNTPPVSPVEGETYVLGSSPTGAWAGQANKIATYYSGWIFLTPAEGMRIWIKDVDEYRLYDGATWVLLSSGGTQYYGNSWDITFDTGTTAPPGG